MARSSEHPCRRLAGWSSKHSPPWASHSSGVKGCRWWWQGHLMDYGCALHIPSLRKTKQLLNGASPVPGIEEKLMGPCPYPLLQGALL